MTEQQTKPGRGCFFYGCMGGLVMALIVVIAGLLGMRYAKKMFTDFTDTKPAELPAVQMSAPEMSQVRSRVDDFKEAVRSKKSVPPLTLSSDELNALISTDSNLDALKGKVYVNIDQNQIKGQVSVPMDEVGLPLFKGRYLNAKGTFEVSLRNGILQLHAQSLEVKGKAVPDIYMQKIRVQNLARDVNNDPRAKVGLEQLESIEVKDGKLVITPHPQ